MAGDLKDFVETPSVSGYENQLSEKIRAKLAAFHPVVDNLGDVMVTIGSGAPHRLIVTPIDEPGFVVSGITADGYLRLQRLPQSGLPPIFNELYSAQPVKVRTAAGKWIDGVVAGISVHLHRADETTPSARDIDNMYVDIGATSAAEARAAGVDILSPVVMWRQLTDSFVNAGPSLGDKFGVAAEVELLRQMRSRQDQRHSIDGIRGPATRWRTRTPARFLSLAHYDEMIYVGQLLPGGRVPGMEGVHRAPRRELGSGVLVGLEQTSGELSGIAADLRRLADANKIPFATDYSAAVTAEGYLPTPAFPARWAHIGIAVAWPDTPAQMIGDDLGHLASLLELYAQGSSAGNRGSGAGSRSSVVTPKTNGALPTTELLRRLVELYGASGHEERVREKVKSFCLLGQSRKRMKRGI